MLAPTRRGRHRLPSNPINQPVLRDRSPARPARCLGRELEVPLIAGPRLGLAAMITGLAKVVFLSRTIQWIAATILGLPPLLTGLRMVVSQMAGGRALRLAIVAVHLTRTSTSVELYDDRIRAFSNLRNALSLLHCSLETANCRPILKFYLTSLWCIWCRSALSSSSDLDVRNLKNSRYTNRLSTEIWSRQVLKDSAGAHPVKLPESTKSANPERRGHCYFLQREHIASHILDLYCIMPYARPRTP